MNDIFLYLMQYYSRQRNYTYNIHIRFPHLLNKFMRANKANKNVFISPKGKNEKSNMKT